MSQIRFGTSGWRAIIADEFTFDNVRKVVQAIATYLKTTGAADAQGRPVIVGGDTRFLSPEFVQTAVDVLTANGLSVLLANDFIPTPVISFQVTARKAAASVNFTASHNPPNYNGIKFNLHHGASAPPEVTKEIERLANGDPGFPASLKRNPALVKEFDPRPEFLAQLSKMIDVPALKKAKLKVGADVLWGTGKGYLDTFLKKSGCRVTVLHDWRDVRFGGMAPEPAEEELKELLSIMKKEKLVAGFGTDGDADRFGIVDDNGTFLSPNEILPIVLRHLVKRRGQKGLVVRSVMTSHFIDAVAKKYDLPVRETPVGFKYIAEAMREGGFLMGGEESGGLTINGHVPEKDGILACLLMAEIRAVEKKPFRDMLKDLRREVGPYLSNRVNLHLEQPVMDNLRKRLSTYTPNAIADLEVKKIVRLDGFKFIFNDDSWLGIRLSGTEPVVRLYLEADSAKKLKHLESVGEQLIQSN